MYYLTDMLQNGHHFSLGVHMCVQSGSLQFAMHVLKCWYKLLLPSAPHSRQPFAVLAHWHTIHVKKSWLSPYLCPHS